MTKWSLDKPGSTEDPARSVVVDPAGPPSGRSAKILFFPVRSAAAYADLEDAMELDGFEPLGSIAVRLVGNFALPRILVMGAPGDLREEVSDPREL